MTISVARILKRHIPFFAEYGKGIERHISHRFTEEMSQKSTVISISNALKKSVGELIWPQVLVQPLAVVMAIPVAAQSVVMKRMLALLRRKQAMPAPLPWTLPVFLGLKCRGKAIICVSQHLLPCC